MVVAARGAELAADDASGDGGQDLLQVRLQVEGEVGLRAEEREGGGGREAGGGGEGGREGRGSDSIMRTRCL